MNGEPFVNEVILTLLIAVCLCIQIGIHRLRRCYLFVRSFVCVRYKQLQLALVIMTAF